MVNVTAGCKFEKVAGTNYNYKTLIVETPATTNKSDTIVIDLAKYHGSKLMGINGFIHSTTDSIVVAEEPTTAVASGVLTITVNSTGTDDKKRVYIVYYK